jgi:CMP-N,N'-diacetyllegionaminic acid synthase
MKNLAIIPARSGSKGLKHKNIKVFAGIPLLTHTIIAAQKSQIFDEIMVSTDSSKYKEVAIRYGANVPFLRTLGNSQDKSSTWDSVKEVIQNYEISGVHFDNIVLLQPTSPLRDYIEIQSAYSLFMEKKADFIASVCEVDHSPLLQNVLSDNLSLYQFIKSNDVNLPRQTLQKYYRLNGAIYIVKYNHLFSDSVLYSKNSFAYIMDKEKSIDIDDEIDFSIAEFLMCRNTEHVLSERKIK